ncbi:hypothetical protein, partial [Niveispirillum sp. KHB5.9]|uniref:hypothetical protein n=1 Tax=Niveispirillum sp. KHB5.9 TaxID=3400269 RepID=UPI003A896892
MENVFQALANLSDFSNNMVALNGELYFGAVQPVAESIGGSATVNFHELYKYNATTNTTTQVTNRVGTSNSALMNMPFHLTVHDGKIFCAGANSNASSGTNDINSRWLISYDPSNSTVTTEYNPGAAKHLTGIWDIGGTLYFTSPSASGSYVNLYRYNSTNDVTNLTG